MSAFKIQPPKLPQPNYYTLHVDFVRSFSHVVLFLSVFFEGEVKIQLKISILTYLCIFSMVPCLSCNVPSENDMALFNIYPV